MALVIGAGGHVDSYTSAALTINTGANTVFNAGVIYAVGAGATLVVSAVDNSGRLWADGGTLAMEAR